MQFQPLSNEEQDIKNHIIQNVFSNFEKDIDKLDTFPVHEAIWSVFMNGCMRAAFCLSEDNEKA